MNPRFILAGFLIVMLAIGWVGACVMWRAAEVGELVQTLEPRRFESLRIITNGTGGPYENPERLGPSTAVGWGSHVLLVDAGRGTAEALRKAQIPVAQPEIVLLTNLLPHNTLGLDDLVFTGWLEDRPTSVRVIGPPGTAAFVAGLQDAYGTGRQALESGLALPAEGGLLKVSEVTGGWSHELDGLRISAAELPGGPTPALAWKLEGSDRTVVVSGTGWGADALVSFASGADVLVHEAVYIPPPEDIEDAGVIADPERLRREATFHTSILEVGALAARAKVATLVLVRMRPPPFFPLQVTSLVGQDFDGEIAVPDDGDEFSP
jgi:ribonuclease BN (tRNA processing enzyme)